jgi:hypothetical protein
MHYRDDRTALESRRDDLRQELADIHRQAAELRSAVHDKEAIERELAAVEARLTRPAPLLDRIRVASPCHASWDAMTGDDRVRFCGECKKDVYNLSAMTRDEAERLLAERAGSLCVRVYKRADGTVLTADCPVGARKKRVRLALLSVAGAGTLAASAALYYAEGRTMGAVEPIMGAIPVVPSDQYVEQPLPEALVGPEGGHEPGLALEFWSQVPGATASTERWKVYADGKVLHEVDAGPGPRLEAVPMDNVDHVGPMLALAAQLRPRAAGITHYYDDSAVRAGVRVYGTGTREATQGDLEQLVEGMRGIRGAFGH